MGLFDFLKKKKTKKVVREIEGRIFVAFEEVTDWLSEKKEFFVEKEKELVSSVEGKVEDFVSELKDKVRVLGEVDVDNKPADNKSKSIVKISLKSYVDHVHRFRDKLRELRHEGFESLVSNIRELLADFESRTFKTYQKVTFLIGKEAAEVKDSFISFKKFLDSLVDENIDLMKHSKTAFFVREKLGLVEDVGSEIKEVKEEIKDLKEALTIEKNEKKRLIEEVKSVKTSKKFLDNVKRKEEIGSDEEKLKKFVHELKVLVDFKALTKFFHGSTRSMDKVKKLREDFFEQISSDSKSFFELLDEAKVNSASIKEKTKSVLKASESLEEEKGLVVEDQTSELEKRVKDVENKIGSLGEDLEKLVSRKKRLEEQKESMKKLVVERINK
ncbi:hypothetical protein GOV05_04085 [Candidatus Woesearchaeota archaeon]|nr:hypothetical protein [Candidatus Woesearchaeota archaeon]